MQKMFDAGMDAAEYQRLGIDYPYPDLTGTPCPHCGGDYLRRHGYYKRHLILAAFEGAIRIRRYWCPACGRTVSLLPSFAHPGRAYGISFVIGALSLYYVDSKGAVGAAKEFSLRYVAECSRQLLRWFRLRFEENLQGLISEATVVFSLRAPPITEKATRKRGKQFLECVLRLNPEDVSKKIFEHSQMSYLTPLPSQ